MYILVASTVTTVLYLLYGAKKIKRKYTKLDCDDMSTDISEDTQATTNIILKVAEILIHCRADYVT